MLLTLLKAKIHRATVTCANINYQGSISIDTQLLSASGILPWERVDIYDIDNGQRFSTYVIPGKTGEITLNGAAARCVHPGDKVIIAAYATMSPDEAANHQPRIVFVDAENAILRERPNN